jgi:2-keto-4-pentenoate hydratase/2-oxohepta-3-ene-1,7-dioic acid hydratase in catechol pathway
LFCVLGSAFEPGTRNPERRDHRQLPAGHRIVHAERLPVADAALVTNVDYNKLKPIGRHNGKVVQETTADLLIFSIDQIVSYTSRYVTLEPGDVVFTGTPGATQAMKPGDTFEVEIVGVGTLRNKVVAESSRTTRR